MNWRAAWRLLRDLTGDSAYERYVAHTTARHPDRPVLPAKEFWRARTDAHTPRTCC
ncbi:hypothetical protein GCM10027589_29740 [Actinocorallia lasiicapitis]